MGVEGLGIQLGKLMAATAAEIPELLQENRSHQSQTDRTGSPLNSQDKTRLGLVFRV